jgi:CRP-like cAMP-binding protein
MIQQTRQFEHCDPRTNLLLASMDPEDYELLTTHAKIVPLKFRKRLLRQDEPVDSVYFPLTSMVSLLVTANNTPQMEMATIGNEGVVGASEVLQTQGAIGLNLVQVPGVALEVNAAKFQEIARTRPRVYSLMQQHLYALLRQILYGAACNRLHSMEERCARWLLMTHDRAGQDTFPLTQDFLSHMLGVRRASVNVVTGMFKKAGFIAYVRGKLTIIDRPGLESAACDCYRDIVRVYSSCIPKLTRKR